MKRYHCILVHGLTLSLSTSLVGCSLAKFNLSENATTSSNSPSPVASASSPTQSIANSPQPAPPTDSFAVLTAPGLQPISTSTRLENYACLTANYFSNIIWQQNQPEMTFGRKTPEGNPVDLAFQDEAATITSNADGSFTYGFNKGDFFYSRVYPDRTCFIQIVNTTNGTVSLEEQGKLGAVVAEGNLQKSEQRGQGLAEWLRQWIPF